jgi:hypothetical protein
MAATVGELVVNLVARTAAFNQGLRESAQQTAQFSTRISTMGSMVTAAAVRFGPLATSALLARKMIRELHEGLLDLGAQGKESQKLGIAPQELTALKTAAEEAGSSAATMVAAIGKMQLNLAEAATTGKGASAALKELGLSASQLEAMGPARAMAAIGEALEKIDSMGHRARIAVELFGKSALDVAASLSKLQEAQERVKRWDLSNPAAVAAGVDYENLIDEFKAGAKSAVEHASLGASVVARLAAGFGRGGVQGAKQAMVDFAMQTLDVQFGVGTKNKQIAAMERELRVAASRAGGEDLLGKMQQGLQFRGFTDSEKRIALWMQEARAAGMAALEVAEFGSKLAEVGRITGLYESMEKRKQHIADLIRGQLTSRGGDGAELAPLATMGSLGAYQAIARQGLQPTQARSLEDIVEAVKRMEAAELRVNATIQDGVRMLTGTETVEIR